MKKLISLALCLALFATVLVGCAPKGCAHQYIDGTCKLCQQTDSNYTPAQGGTPTTPCAHRYVSGTCVACGATDSSYVAATPIDPQQAHAHSYVDGVCTICHQPDGAFVAPTYTQGQLSVVGNGKYLLADENGNYGGTLNRGKYGDGAPLNGMYDDNSQQYYNRNDFYNMQSTKMADGTIERTIYTGFAPYQQTMANSGAMAGMVAVLNYWGEAVTTSTELELVEKYEQINATSVVDAQPTAQGLVNLWNALEYQTELQKVTITGSNRNDKINSFRVVIEPLLDAGKMVFLRHQDSTDSHWKVVVGYDNMGTLDWNYDDIIIFADPNDCWDHYQDGYAFSGGGRFAQWFMTVSEAGKQSNAGEMVVVTPKTPVTINRILGSEDPTQVAQFVPENHIIRNWGQAPDLEEGSYGGTMNESLYGGGAQKNGKRDHLDRSYYKYVDCYNLTSNDNRLVLTGYRGFTQTHKSSCGPCALFSITTYYGYDRNVFHEEAIVKKYQEVTGVKIAGKGSSGPNIKLTLEAWGFTNVEAGLTSTSNWQERPFPTYEAFIAFVKGHLAKGNPIAISWRPCGGHWETIFGYDDMGTDFIYDDVILLADSGDTWDHYQDGYNVHAATIILRHWFNLSINATQGYFVVDRASNTQFEVANSN